MNRRQFFGSSVLLGLAWLSGRRPVVADGLTPVVIRNPYVIFTDPASYAMVEHFTALDPDMAPARLHALCYMADLNAWSYLGHPISQFEYVWGRGV